MAWVAGVGPAGEHARAPRGRGVATRVVQAPRGRPGVRRLLADLRAERRDEALTALFFPSHALRRPESMEKIRFLAS